jgi:hypothetical protein
MSPVKNDRALSEIIGFILILTAIIVAVSLYLTYAVPAQGRENEILHMNEIHDQFVVYKIGIDALWTNSQVGNAMSTTFNLGTTAAATQGGSFIIPVINPVPSGGTLALNQRQETLTVQSRSLMADNVTLVTNKTPLFGSFPINATPRQLNVNIYEPNPSDYSSGKRSVLVRPQGLNWSVNVTVNPRTTYYNYTTTGPFQYHDAYMYTGTDITIDVTKGGVTTLQDFTVHQNINSSWYSVNLLDDAYGLKNYIQYPITAVTFNQYDSRWLSPFPTISAYGSVNISYEQEQVSRHNITLGALEYHSGNNYWISQTYFYQNGGIFLEQEDGTSVKLPPTITFSFDNRTAVATVKVVELPFQQTDTGNIGGNSPVQVRTRVTTIRNLSYSQAYNNTKYVNLTVSSGDSRALQAWQRALDSAANTTGGVPDTYYSTGASATQAWLYLNGIDPTGTQFDIHLEGLRANLSASVQGG